MTPEVEYLTKEKYNELEEELKQLKSERRKEIAEDLEFAKSLGDLSENAEYHQAREAQAKLEDRIAQVENMLKTAVIISGKKKGDSVEVGSTVTVVKDGSKAEQTYHLVGSEEANMSEAKISHKSPLGESLFGKKKGEIAIFKAPNGNQIRYKIVKVD